MMTTRKICIAGLLIAGVTTLTGCDKMMEPYKDAPRSGQVNNDPADVVTMPDGFSNLATKCDHGNRIYVIFHGNNKYGTVAVVPNAKDCGNG